MNIMKIKNIMAVAAVVLTLPTMQSCLDFDSPTDEFQATDVVIDDDVYSGKPDNINYLHQTTQEGMDEAIDNLSENIFGFMLTAQYAMRGGKDGDYPGPHAYQRQFSLGPDGYAQYATIPHQDFMYGTLTSTYDISIDFNPGPNSSYLIVKNALAPALNHPDIDSIPELKAINLLLFDYASQEVADLYGPFPYRDFKNNREVVPFTYNDLRTIYCDIEKNINTIIECLQYYPQRPDWYKQRVKDILDKYIEVNLDKQNGVTDMSTWIRLAASLKLRMAMHIVKVEPDMARRWAEEAVKIGVVESKEQESLISLVSIGRDHPLLEIWKTWGDARLSASFESLLMSLGHPYTKYLFLTNSDPIVNEQTKEILPAGTRVVGIREGAHTGQGQSYGNNQYIAFSSIETRVISKAPLYLMKWSEVDFLRAEGALRGWDMGGSAQFFYERGIENGYVDNPQRVHREYTQNIQTYMQRTEPIDYTYIDPTGTTPNMPSVTKIGVKWNDDDDLETKLEKIITQKYISQYPYSFEAWTDLRRTGYPRMFPVLNPDDGDGSLLYGDIIRRMVFPNTDDASIKDINETGLKALGGPDLQATRLWWDVNTPNF